MLDPHRRAASAFSTAGLILLGLAGGCSGEEDFDTAAPLFEPDRVLAVEIEMDPADWEVLRAQTRTVEDLLGRPDCLDSPFPDPFTYFPATVVVDGEQEEGVAVRKKGFLGSLDSAKPSLKVSFDELEPDRTYSGLEKLTLNNSRQDPSYIDQCIAYALFGRAGLPAPRCNFAVVTVNGEALGLYVHVESIEDELLAHHFGDSDGNLYEGTLSDFRSDWSGTFEKKNNEEEADWSDLQAVIAAAEVPDDQLLGSLDQVIDLEEFLVFWALESLLAHWDGYAGNVNNFWLYQDGGRLHFVPWGADQVLVYPNPVQPAGALQSVFVTGVLPWRIYRIPEGRERYAAALRQLLDEVWDEAWLGAEIDRIEALLAPLVEGQGFAQAVADRRAFIAARRAALTAELDAGLPDLPQGLRDPFCQ